MGSEAMQECLPGEREERWLSISTIPRTSHTEKIAKNAKNLIRPPLASSISPLKKGPSIRLVLTSDSAIYSSRICLLIKSRVQDLCLEWVIPWGTRASIN